LSTSQSDGEEVGDSSSSNEDESRQSFQSHIQTRQKKNREKMTNKHCAKRNKKLIAFEVGEFVTVLIPAVDRGHSDMPRLPAKITKIIEKENTVTRYNLVSVHGVLDVNYCGRDLEKYTGVLRIDPKAMDTQISLHTAAGLASNHTSALTFANVKCNCKTDCKSGHCACFKSLQKCTSHCHSQNAACKCKNK
jgi:hypothetical protein